MTTVKTAAGHKKSAEQRFTVLGAWLLHSWRRQLGSYQISKVRVKGKVPNQVIRAIKLALADRPYISEWKAIDEIEHLRSEYLASYDLTVRRPAEVSKPPRWAYLLFRLIRELRPEMSLEMGTAAGISAAYQLAGLQLNSSATADFVTLEGNESRAELARDTLRRLGLADNARVIAGRFESTLGPLLKDLKPINWAFIDGHHQEEPTLAYICQILPHLADQAVLVFDDIRWSEGMERLWKRLMRDTRFSLAVDLGSVGILVFDKTPGIHQQVKIAYA